MGRLDSGPRERALDAGVDALGDADLISLVLGTGRPGAPVGVVAAEVLDALGGVAGLAHAGLGSLSALRGLGPARGARLAAALELGRRAAAEALRAATIRLSEPRAVDAWARPRLASLDHEELWLLALDGRNGLRAARRLATGGTHGAAVTVRDVLRVALREGASGFVLVHNHPSGDPEPSPNDIDFTWRVGTAAEIVGAQLLDHVITARDGFVALAHRCALGPRPGSENPNDERHSLGRGNLRP